MPPSAETFIPAIIEFKIGAKLISVDTSKMSEEEIAVFSVIYETPHITQRQIANTERWLGCHEKFEDDLPIPDKTETTLRRVRQIIRNLRLKNKCPILSDRNGYWIPANEQEVKECMVRMEQQARSSAKAYMVTYYELHKVFNIRSEYFEAQLPLFAKDDLSETEIKSNNQPDTMENNNNEDDKSREDNPQSSPVPSSPSSEIKEGTRVRYTELALIQIPTAATRNIYVVNKIKQYSYGRVAVMEDINGNIKEANLVYIEKVN